MLRRWVRPKGPSRGPGRPRGGETWGDRRVAKRSSGASTHARRAVGTCRMPPALC